MEKIKHELLLDGTVEPGASLATAVEELTQLFKDKAGRFQPLLDGQPVSHTLNITPEHAEKLQAFLATIGLQGQVIPKQSAASAPAENTASGLALEPLHPEDEPVDVVAMAGVGTPDATVQQSPAADTPAKDTGTSANPTSAQPAKSGGMTLQLEPMEEARAEKPETAATPEQGFACPKCGVAQEPAEQCSACGIFFAKYRSQQGGATVSAPAAPSATRADAVEEESTLEEDMLEFVRENGYYYSPKFDAFRDADDKYKPGWHWPGFFFPFHWALYRKLWLWAGALFIVPVLLAPAVPFFSLILINVVFAMSANFIYYKHVKNEVTKLRKRHRADPETLARTGGISWPAVVAGLVLPFIFSGFLLSWMMPEGFMNFGEMQASYEAQDPEVMKTRQGQETFLNMSMAKLAIVLMVQQGEIQPHDVGYDSLVEKGMPANTLIDGWGTPFHIEAEGKEVFITSAGPDQEFETGDDLEQ